MTQDDIFKRLALANKFISETEFKVLEKTLQKMRAKGQNVSLIDLAMEKQKLSESQAKMLDRPIRYNMLRYEDRMCCKLLISNEVITPTQMEMFMEDQSIVYREKHQIVSALELMKKKGLLTVQQVNSTKNTLRNLKQQKSVTGTSLDLVAVSPNKGKGPEDEIKKGNFVVKYLPKTIEVNNRPAYMTLLKISGQVDSYSAPVLDKMCRDVFALAGDRGRFIIMDMTNVSYMSSAGISIIVGWRKEAQERAGNIHFVGMTKEVVGVFKLLGIEDTLFICDNSNEAMWAFMKNK